MQAHTRN